MIFGVGGGSIIVPAVSIFLHRIGYSHNISMKTAIATSLITIMASTLNVLYQKNKIGDMPWALIGKFLPFVLTGGLIGSIIASKISGELLTYLFMAFLLYIIVYSFLNKNFKTSYQLTDFTEPPTVKRSVVGFFIGTLSILIGISGNILFIPYLRYYKCPMKTATAFTIGIMPALAFIGSMGYLIAGIHLNEAKMPAYSLGYINLPIFILIFFGSFIGAFFGQKLLKYINDNIQAQAYLIFLMIIFLLMLESIR
jgi:uncharacterized membrane protein YfcA